MLRIKQLAQCQCLQKGAAILPSEGKRWRSRFALHPVHYVGISITRSAVDLPSAPLPRGCLTGHSATNQLRPPHPLLPQRGGVMMVPYITSDGLEAPNRGAMMTASSFSCRMGNLAFHLDVTSRLCLNESAACLMSSLGLSEKRSAHRFDPLITADR